MAADDLIRQGAEFEAAGNMPAAESAYAAADEMNSAEGAILFGLVLQRRGDSQGAVNAFVRAEARGHREAGTCLGNLLSDYGDHDGAKGAYERSVALGSSDAVLNLGLMLAQQGNVSEAIRYLSWSEENGDAATASWAIGRLLEGQDDLRGAGAAYERSTAAGNADAAFALGAVLSRLDEKGGARAAFQRAHELGNGQAAEVLQMLDRETNAHDGVMLAQRYAAACASVLSASSACLEVSNRAVEARNTAAQRPQHEISIRNFTTFAEEAERDFGPLYQRFVQSTDAARQAAAALLASQGPDPLDAEMLLATTVGFGDALDDIAVVRAILGTDHGPSPAAFVHGVEAANQLMMQVGDGNIYRPPSVTSSDERTCPWCAETIKGAAVICRFCQRNV